MFFFRLTTTKLKKVCEKIILLCASKLDMKAAGVEQQVSVGRREGHCTHKPVYHRGRPAHRLWTRSCLKEEEGQQKGLISKIRLHRPTRGGGGGDPERRNQP